MFYKCFVLKFTHMKQKTLEEKSSKVEGEGLWGIGIMGVNTNMVGKCFPSSG